MSCKHGQTIPSLTRNCPTKNSPPQGNIIKTQLNEEDLVSNVSLQQRLCSLCDEDEDGVEEEEEGEGTVVMCDKNINK